jgi:hypothetical protein
VITCAVLPSSLSLCHFCFSVPSCGVYVLLQASPMSLGVHAFLQGAHPGACCWGGQPGQGVISARGPTAPLPKVSCRVHPVVVGEFVSLLHCLPTSGTIRLLGRPWTSFILFPCKSHAWLVLRTSPSGVFSVHVSELSSSLY